MHETCLSPSLINTLHLICTLLKCYLLPLNRRWFWVAGRQVYYSFCTTETWESLILAPAHAFSSILEGPIENAAMEELNGGSPFFPIYSNHQIALFPSLSTLRIRKCSLHRLFLSKVTFSSLKVHSTNFLFLRLGALHKDRQPFTLSCLSLITE